jgi:hypothetical protein
MLGAVLFALAQTQGTTLAFDNPAWAFQPEAAVKAVEFLGRPALVIGTGRALRRDITFADGTVEFDLAVTGGRAFAYFQFRMTSDEDHEEIYFRPHKNGLPDAIQYAPVHQGLSAWQLYHGPGGTAPAEFVRNGWTHIKIVIAGPSAAVFVGDVTTPQLVVPRMARPGAEGYIALRNFLPAGVDPAKHSSGFANLVLRPGVVDYDFSKVNPVSAPPGTIPRWEVSRTFVPDSGPVRFIDDSILKSAQWRTLSADASGLLNFAIHLTVPDSLRVWGAAARVTLTADRPRTVRLLLGFSDRVTVFLNGKPLFSGDQRYFFDNPRQEGVIGFHQATVYLQLQQGPNEVMLAVSDQFGGWGVVGRLLEAEGVRIQP